MSAEKKAATKLDLKEIEKGTTLKKTAAPEAKGISTRNAMLGAIKNPKNAKLKEIKKPSDALSPAAKEAYIAEKKSAKK